MKICALTGVASVEGVLRAHEESLHADEELAERVNIYCREHVAMKQRD